MRPWPVRRTWASTRREISPTSSAARAGNSGSGSGGVETPSEASWATSVRMRSGSGRSWTRYKQGTRGLRELPCHGFVCGDHQVLDQAVGLGLRARPISRDIAVLVERKLGLLGVDHERAARLARLLQLGGRGASGRERPAPWFRCRLVAARRRDRRARSPGACPSGSVERQKLAERTSAPRNSISTLTARRSAPGTSEQASLESACGSIGSTVPGT